MKHKAKTAPVTPEAPDTPPSQDSQNTPKAQEAQHAGAATKSAQDLGAQAEQRIAELTNDLQRTRADFENFRKQVEVQRAQAVALTRVETVAKFLPLIDDFDRALQAYPEQLEPLRKGFEKTLQTLGLAKIDSDPNTEFNPDFHEAVSVEDADGETEVIVETLRPGYLYDGNVIRVAMVKVKRV